jgi:ATP-dependent helicase/nuclease subunit B
MALIQFILGRSGTGKTRWCLDEVCAALADGSDEPLILLVPEQATYQAERAILSHPEIAGFSRLRVLSFNRLSFWLEGSRRGGGADLSRTGKQMALHKLLLDLSGQLELYKGDVRRTGLASKLSDLVTELQANNCTARQVQLLTETLAQKPGQELAAAKWRDIAAIFTAYEDFFQSAEGRFINPDEGLKIAKKNAAAASFLKGARLWVDGFSGFTAQELDLLAELLRICKEAAIALCLDPAGIELDNDDESKLDPCSLFALTEQTYCQLRRIVRACKLTLKDPVILDAPRRFEKSPALAVLEANLAAPDTPAKPASGKGAIHIAACGTIRTETLWAAKSIRRLVQDEGLRYRDIAVVVPDMTAYQHYIESAFSRYTIPHFLDRPRQMKAHPLVELTGAALQAALGGFGLADVMSFLKSGMAGVPFDAVDELETYCRAFDVQGDEWPQKEAWNFASREDAAHYDQKRLDDLRQKAVKPLVSLRRALTQNTVMTAAQFAQTIWCFLESLDVRTTLAKLAEGDLSDQQFGHRQLFSKLVDVLEEMCSVFSDTALSAEAWEAIFIEALSNVAIKLIPPTLDQVLVGSIERSRHPDVQAIILVGATQKQFPVPVMGETMLSEQDYRLAQDAQMELANPYQQQLTHRPYLSYIALTRASRQLFISYPLLDEKGGSVVPGLAIEQLGAMFADVAIEYPQTQGEQPEDIQTPQQLGRWLCGHLGKDRPAQDGDEAIAAGVLDRTRMDDELSAIGQHAARALAYDNAARLDEPTVGKLFTLPMHASVTKLGSFAACPYQHFSRYVLRLEPRERLELEPMDVGTFYHKVLEGMFGQVNKCGHDWGDLSDEELVSLCDEQVERILATDTQLINFMRRRAHHRYIIQSAQEVIRGFMPALAQLSRAGVFKQQAAELKFDFTIKRGQTPFIQFSGKIDRLDTAEIDGQQVGVVFDYKSGVKRVDFAKILYGLDLQLPVYLLAIGRVHNETTDFAEHTDKGLLTGSENSQKRCLTPLISVGAFFVSIQGESKSKSLVELGQNAPTINKAKGLFDGGFFDALDRQAAGGWSRYYNFFVNKDGDPYSNYRISGALKPGDFAALLSFAEHRVVKLAAELSGGKIDITPYRLGTTSPCSWCDFRAVCRFDWQVNDYNILEPCNKEQALEKMKEMFS